MKSKKQRRVLGAVLGVGLTVLAVDRLVLSDPTTGPEEAVGDAFAARPASTLPATLLPIDPEVGPSIADRLRSAASSARVRPDEVREAFVAPDAWSATAASPSGRKTSAQTGPSSSAARHRLMAVMGSGSQAVAIVDGQPVRVGGTVGELRLVAVGQRSAVFDSATGRVELTLAEDGR